jgi:hypothetical protein
LKRLGGFRSEVARAWRHALMRRSQRHRMSWVRFNKISRHFLPNVCLVHPYPEERFLRHHLR